VNAGKRHLCPAAPFTPAMRGRYARNTFFRAIDRAREMPAIGVSTPPVECRYVESMTP
jgi:hypothetical protein